MAITIYNYNVSSDTANGVFNEASLQIEVTKSSIVIALDSMANLGDDTFDVRFKDTLSAGDKTTLDGVVAAHQGIAPPPLPELVSISNKTTSDNRIRVAIEKSNQATKNFYTHNWCDKTTWYEKAVRVVDEVATDSGDQLRYTLTNQYIVDTYHGKISKEDDLLDPDGYSYRAAVTVDGYAKTEQDPHYGTGGDFTVNYTDGYINFINAQSVSAEIKVTYHYATTSVFTIIPDSGKALNIEVAEVQFSQDVDLKDTVKYQVYGYVDVFAPELTPVPYPSGTKIPIRTNTYKTMADFQNDAIKAYSTYPVIGGSSWRGMQQPVLILDWDYLRGNTLSSAAGMEVRMFLEHDKPFGGTFGTATFYSTIENEI